MASWAGEKFLSDLDFEVFRSRKKVENYKKAPLGFNSGNWQTGCVV